MPEQGYFRFPSLWRDTIVFTCEDDLWAVPAAGGVARRLTANAGECSRSALSPDGALLAFTGKEEGNPEVYLMPAEGGAARRLTFQGAALGTHVVGWTPDGESVVFTSNAGQPFLKLFKLFSVPKNGGLPAELPYGAAMSISYGPGKRAVIGRNTLDIARWKRYRGGTAGELWVDAAGAGKFKRLLSLKGNFTNPMWIGGRIYFIGDHEGFGNLYSCAPTGADVRRHTNHEEYYARNAATDGENIVYHAGGDLLFFDVAANETRNVEVEFRSPRVQTNRKFVETGKYLQDYAVHPAGHSLALTARGKSFTMPFWEEAPMQQGARDGVRYRLSQWLNDGKRIVAISDEGGEERIEVHHADNAKPKARFEKFDVGRPLALLVSPVNNQIVLANQRQEVIWLDLDANKMRVLDKSPEARIGGICWAPDGRWIAYGFPDTAETAYIKICDVSTGKSRRATKTVWRDANPSFDPEGKYLYFISYREFNPVYDSIHFDLNFPRGSRPFALPLRKDIFSPFIPAPRAPEAKAAKMLAQRSVKNGKPARPAPVEIDFDGIEDRTVAFPVPEGLYDRIIGLERKAVFSSFPIQGGLDAPANGIPANGTLESYDFSDQKRETIVEAGITDFTVGRDNRTLVYRAGKRLRVLVAGEPPNGKNAGAEPSRQTGWIDLSRLKVSIQPLAEWRQMYREAWRLQRDQFWTADMSHVDWQRVYSRYERLVGRCASRSEFSDLMWEMQGELGTSHCYEMGGDYRPEPRYSQGFLGADFQYEKRRRAYRIAHIVRGDSWKDGHDSPLNAPGVNAAPGITLAAVDGVELGDGALPQQLLVNHAGENVSLVLADRDGKNRRAVTVRTLASELKARYREWVETNRAYVHRRSNGEIGYVHIPDMMSWGFSEFHRYYLAETMARKALVVDARFNGGGHVSQLILEKLARKRLGYDTQRYGQPVPYPSYAMLGPVVAITNENAGSDGDIFSHNFKQMKIGTLVGKRTWGGVIGIWPRHALVDGTVTTQPEYSFWFNDVGWGVENYGTEPDIDVDIAPQDYAAGKDPQLDAALREAQRLMKLNPPRLPEFANRPDLSPPKLPRAR